MNHLFRLELERSHCEGQTVSPLKRQLDVHFGSPSLPPPARHGGNNLEELNSDRDGSHGTGEPHLIKSWARLTEQESLGERNLREFKAEELPACLPHLLQDKLKPQRNKS